MTTKRVAFSKPGDEVGEPSVEFHLYDYCDSQSVASEAASIDLSLIKDQQKRNGKTRGKHVRGNRVHDAGMGKLLRRASITSEISQDISGNSSAENSFWDNEENSFADYANLSNPKGGQKASGKLMQRASITSEISGTDNSFWNNEENSFADYAQFGAQKQPRRVSGSFRVNEDGFSDIRFDDEESLSDSVLSMGSFALDGGVEIVGFEDMKNGEELGNNNHYTAFSKAAMLDGSMDSWSITESVLKEEVDGEVDLKDPMPMRRADRRAQRARDRLSAYSRVPSRNGSIGSMSSNPRRNGSLGKYSDHSGPRRTGSLGKYSDHSLGSISMSSGPRRTGSLGKYSDHTPRSFAGRRLSAAPGHRRNGSSGSAAVLAGRIRPASPKRDDEEGSPTLRQRNCVAADAPKPDDEEGSPTLRQRNGRKSETKKEPSSAAIEKKDSIVASKVTKEMKKKKLGSDLPAGGASLRSPRTASLLSPRTAKAMKIKMGKDSDRRPRSASLRQHLLG